MAEKIVVPSVPLSKPVTKEVPKNHGHGTGSATDLGSQGKPRPRTPDGFWSLAYAGPALGVLRSILAAPAFCFATPNPQ